MMSKKSDIKAFDEALAEIDQTLTKKQNFHRKNEIKQEKSK